MKHKAEYVEGQKARKNFERVMKNLFKAPKTPKSKKKGKD